MDINRTIFLKVSLYYFHYQLPKFIISFIFNEIIWIINGSKLNKTLKLIELQNK